MMEHDFFFLFVMENGIENYGIVFMRASFNRWGTAVMMATIEME